MVIKGTMSLNRIRLTGHLPPVFSYPLYRFAFLFLSLSRPRYREETANHARPLAEGLPRDRKFA